jgi:L-iditol 2-dehydrogenase
VSNGLRALRPAGRAVIVGMGPAEEMAIPMTVVQNREIWLTGTFRYANTYPAAIALAADRRVNLQATLTGTTRSRRPRQPSEPAARIPPRSSRS